MIIAVNFQLKQPERRRLKKNQAFNVEALIFFFRLLLSGCLSWKFTAMIIL